jgi:hypothetical protein
MCQLKYGHGRSIITRMTETTFGTFPDLLTITPESLRPVAERLRAIIWEADPQTVEVVRLGDRAATYGTGPRKMIDGYAYIMPHQNWINLGFYQGASLPDPAGLLEGTGKKLRHVKVRSLAEAEQPELRELIETAMTERRAA